MMEPRHEWAVVHNGRTVLARTHLDEAICAAADRELAHAGHFASGDPADKAYLAPGVYLELRRSK